MSIEVNAATVALAFLSCGLIYSAIGFALVNLMERDDIKRMTWEQRKKRDATLGGVLVWPAMVVVGLVLLVASPFVILGDKAEARSKRRHEARLKSEKGL